MKEINIREIKKITKEFNAKENRGFNNPLLKDNYIKAIQNLNEIACRWSAYELGNFINDIALYTEHIFRPSNVFNYHIGTICIADLGALNFGCEISYPHPCVVVSSTKEFIQIVPCSSSKAEKGHRDILEATIEDGFKENTGLILDNTRWISKSRVLYHVGAVTKPFLKKIRIALSHYNYMDLETYYLSNGENRNN